MAANRTDRESRREPCMPTMAEVAARAGVSVGLSYTPSDVARDTHAGTAQILGLVISDVGKPFFTAAARGAEDVAHRHGYSLVPSNTNNGPRTSDRVMSS